MVSFYQLWEQLDKEGESPLMNSGIESKAIQAIRAGENLRGDDEPSFWDDFIQLCANSDGFAELLGVRREVVTSWPKKIEAARSEMKKNNKHPDEEKEPDKKEMIPTGKNGAVTVQNMGPFGMKR